MEAVRLLKKRPWGIAGAVILLVMVVVAALAPVLAPYASNQIDLRNALQPPGGEHLLGSDNLGRDVFSQLLYGVQPYVAASLIATALAVVIGLLLGIISAKAGGRTDKVLRWVAVLLPVLPSLALLFLILHFLLNYVAVFLPFPIRMGLVIRAVAETDRWTLCGCITLLISLVFLPAMYRTVRAAFTPAAPGPGLKPLVPLSLVTFGAAIGLAVVFVAWAGYQGIGLPPGIPEWGRALSGEGRQYLETAPWIARYQFIAIAVAVAGSVLFMQATRELWFPRLSGGK